VLVNKVRLERTRGFGSCFVGLELWKRLELDRFFAQNIDSEGADVPWSRVAALLAINRLCAPGSGLSIEQRWYPSTALDDLLEIEDGKINDTRLYRCLDRILPHKTKLERHLKERYGALFGAEFDVLLYDLTKHLCGRGGGKEPHGAPRLLAGSSARLRAVGDCTDRKMTPMKARAPTSFCPPPTVAKSDCGRSQSQPQNRNPYSASSQSASQNISGSNANVVQTSQ